MAGLGQAGEFLGVLFALDFRGATGANLQG